MALRKRQPQPPVELRCPGCEGRSLHRLSLEWTNSGHDWYAERYGPPCQHVLVHLAEYERRFPLHDSHDVHAWPGASSCPSRWPTASVSAINASAAARVRSSSDGVLDYARRGNSHRCERGYVGDDYRASDGVGGLRRRAIGSMAAVRAAAMPRGELICGAVTLTVRVPQDFFSVIPQDGSG